MSLWSLNLLQVSSKGVFCFLWPLLHLASSGDPVGTKRYKTLLALIDWLNIVPKKKGCYMYMQGSTVVQRLAQPPHSKKVVGLIPGQSNPVRIYWVFTVSMWIILAQKHGMLVSIGDD